MPQRIVAIDSQKLNIYQECQRKYDYIFNRNLVPLQKPRYFEEGDLVHVMLAQYYKLRKYKSRWQMNHHTHADILDICVLVGQYHALKLQLPIDDMLETIDAFKQSVIFHANDGWDDILFVEKVGSRVLYESPELVILYEVKIDLGVRISNISILPIDHKTSKRNYPPAALSNQFMGYCWFLGCKNICVNKIGFQTSLKPEQKFVRPLISYDPDVLEDWRENTITWVQDMLKSFDSSNYKANLTSCDKYSGCIFREVCTTARTSRTWKLDRDFEVRASWDIGKKL